jgi:pimeloyl-ACP methyl ester carboxylesterase
MGTTRFFAGFTTGSSLRDMKRRKAVLALLLILTSFFVGGLTGFYYQEIKSRLISNINIWDNTDTKDWPKDFSVVKIPSSVDDAEQYAYFLDADSGSSKPLVVSLHTWSGNYSQDDPLASMSANAGWNYIHPDFRGPNWTPDACLSEKAIADINDAIQYAKDNGNVDTSNIFVVGVSGGGYATLGAYLRTQHEVKAFLSWVPISDLSAWYYQSLRRKSKYAQDILKCTSEGMELNESEARLRSPLFWEVPDPPTGRLEIYAGINDGYTGSVPISHSILFYNRIARHLGSTDVVTQAEMVELLTRGIEHDSDLGRLGDRHIYYRRGTDLLALTIFDGGHEMLPEYCFERMKKIAEQGAGRDGDSAVLPPRR